MNKKGFTLVELLVVIAIIGLLSTIAVVSLSGARNKAVGTKVAADLRTVQSALEAYAADNTNYPTSTVAWASTNIANYMPNMPTAPTGATYLYCLSANGQYYLLAATGVTAGVEPAGLNQTSFTAPAANRCSGGGQPGAINCSLDTVYCMSNTTTAAAFAS
ncbi:MAG: prepilin-type N-terminal cleavage/methylation domain-containing protein [Candidatus Komeilibacteria bacterium]|nr:prepilin-type N-terminal cleavage/methylation domain-containing protein [Candidatus Komeilibacteria bacterium]